MLKRYYEILYKGKTSLYRQPLCMLHRTLDTFIGCLSLPWQARTRARPALQSLTEPSDANVSTQTRTKSRDQAIIGPMTTSFADVRQIFSPFIGW